MTKSWGIGGLAMAAFALAIVFGCGDGNVGAGSSGGEDIGSAADLLTTDDTVPSPGDALPDTSSDAGKDTWETPDTEAFDASPDSDTQSCWSCTTEDAACLCGCVACHTNKSLLQELAPDEPVEGTETGGG